MSIFFRLNGDSGEGDVEEDGKRREAALAKARAQSKEGGREREKEAATAEKETQVSQDRFAESGGSNPTTKAKERSRPPWRNHHPKAAAGSPRKSPAPPQNFNSGRVKYSNGV